MVVKPASNEDEEELSVDDILEESRGVDEVLKPIQHTYGQFKTGEKNTDPWVEPTAALPDVPPDHPLTDYDS